VSRGVLRVWDKPHSLLGARTAVLEGYVVISRHRALTRRGARAKAMLSVARILEKDLTARFEH